MRYRQLVVLEVFCDDDAFETGWPVDWPWEQMVRHHVQVNGHDAEHVSVKAAGVTEQVLDDGWAEDGYEYEPGQWRYKHCEPEHTPFHVNVYGVGQGYGGPEEGGWWFSTGEPVEDASVVCETADAAVAMVKLLREEYPRTDKQFSVLGGEDYDVRIEDHPPRAWPTRRPHYE